MLKSSTQLNLIPKENDLLIHPIFHQSSPPYPTPKSTFEVSQVVPQGDSSSSNVVKISPIVLLIIIILAAFFFILGFLHLLFRYLSKRPPSRSLFIHSNRFTITTDHQGSTTSSSHVLQRQLQQLFRLHDSGLDQSSIDNLPVFHYKDVLMGLVVSKSKQQFDCAVCLSEFSNQDKLKLLPICSHAFHINCIDPWLMSNSTCPLCRCTLLNPSSSTSLSSLTPLTTSDDCSIGMSLSTDSTSASNSSSCSATLDEKRVYSIRLGKFKTLTNDETEDDGEISGSGKLDGRRCYSMGSYQYVVTHDTYLKFKGVDVNGDCVSINGKKIGRSSLKGDSFSVSKIWLWSKKKKYDDHHHHHHQQHGLKVGGHGGVIGGLEIV